MTALLHCRLWFCSLWFCVTWLFSLPAFAAGLSGDQLQQRLAAARMLGQQLTPMGAEQAGTPPDELLPALPPWRGGLRTPPPEFDGTLQNPYAREAAVATIQQDQLAQWNRLLPTGLKVLLQQVAPLIRVYPSHRSATAPESQFELAYRNRIRVDRTLNGGFQYGQGAIPFPQPAKGDELLWNHLLAWRGTRFDGKALQIQAELHSNDVSSTEMLWQVSEQWPWHQADNSGCGHACLGEQAEWHQEQQMLLERHWQLLSTGDLANTNRPGEQGAGSWQQQLYLDAGKPMNDVNLMGKWPEGWQNGAELPQTVELFNSLPAEYHWSVLGKSELVVPYHNYPVTFDDARKDAAHVEQWVASLRFEKHRVWVVDGALRKGASNRYRKRVYYIDEDSWQILVADFYDASGGLQAVGLNLLYSDYRTLMTRSSGQALFDLGKQSIDLIRYIEQSE